MCVCVFVKYNIINFKVKMTLVSILNMILFSPAKFEYFPLKQVIPFLLPHKICLDREKHKKKKEEKKGPL